MKDLKTIKWQQKLLKVEKYIVKYHKKPPFNSALNRWLREQEKSEQRDNYIQKKWERFISEYDLYNLSQSKLEKEYHSKITWESNLEKLEEYIVKNNRLPNKKDKDKEVKRLAVWYDNHRTYYNSQIHIMKNPEIQTKWKEFTEKYSKIFNSKRGWYETFQRLKNYIDTNHKKPSYYSPDYEVKKLNYWMNNQQHNYHNKIKNMKSNSIYNIWDQFIRDYDSYFNKNDCEYIGRDILPHKIKSDEQLSTSISTSTSNPILDMHFDMHLDFNDQYLNLEPLFGITA